MKISGKFILKVAGTLTIISLVVALLLGLVNGVTADYEKDQTYWSLYIDGEYAQTGVDMTAVNDGSTYKLAIETMAQ